MCSTNLSGQISFTTSGLAGESLSNPTSLQFGPDGRLYVSQLDGTIFAYNIQKTGPNNYQISNTETILLVKQIPNYNDDGTLNAGENNRQVAGILLTGTSSNPIMYVSSSDPRAGDEPDFEDLNLDTNSGVISKLTWNGSSWTKLDVVRGLPRSEHNHSTYGMQLDEATNTLYVNSGGNTNAGSPSTNFAYLTEYALSAAILKIDLDMIDNSFGGSYDLPTLDDPTRSNTGPGGSDVGDPFGGNDGLNQAKIVIGGPVQIHAPGFRNSYDLVLTQTAGVEGRLYTIDNGANLGWGGYPENEGASNVTNNYVIGEPGSLGPGANDAQVNNLDNLHLVSGPGFGPIYGGHPNPIRANPAGAGLYRRDASNQEFFESSPTVDWPPVPVSLANPVEADFQNPGIDDAALYTWSTSTNGLVEYTATNFFGGAMTGDLLTASFDGKIYRIELAANGQSVTSVEVFASGFGSTPLDVTAQGTGDIFEGTVWAATYGSNNITVFEPGDPSSCSPNINDYLVDSDGDGYTDGDETDNGTDPCSAANQPTEDFDQTLINGFLVSNLNDPDDDDDGLLDLEDPFVWDASNGKGLQAPFFNDLFSQQGNGFGGTGLTGLMNNGTTDYLDQFVSDEVILGGPSGLLTIPVITSGDAFVNSFQENAFQFGVDVSSQTGPFTVSTKINGPFFNNTTPVNWQSQGFYIGTGDQSNYLKLVLTANNGVGGFQIFQEIDGSKAPSPNDQAIYSVNGLLNANSIELFLSVDPSTGIVQPKYSLNGGVVSDLGATFVLQGKLLDVVQGNYAVNGQPSAMAVGAIATSFNNKPQFAGTWDYFSLTVDNSSSNPILLSSIPDQFNQEGDEPSLAVSATGGSANLNYSATGLPTGLDIGPTNGQILGTIAAGASAGGPANDGIFTATITVDDGGINSSVNTSFTWTVNIVANSWTVINNINNHIGRHENSFTQVGDKFYLIGGRETDQVEIYNYNTNSWAGGAVSPSTIHHFQALAYQGYIWAITGFKDNNFPTEQPADNVFLYDPVEDQWIVGPDIPDSRKRGSAGVVQFNDKFYIVGGLQNGHTSGWVPWLDEYDPQTNTWIQLPDAPQARDHFHATVVGDKLYVAGGRRSGEIDTFTPTIPEVDVFDFGTGTWMTTSLPDDLPVPRAGTSTVTFNGEVVVIGGEGDGNAYDLTDALNVITGQWRSVATLNTGRHGTQAIVSGNGIHITSGSPNQDAGNMNNMEVFGVDNPSGTPIVKSTLAGPGSFDFGNVAGNTTLLFSNTVGNQGIYIKSVSLAGPDASEFAITGGSPGSKVILRPGADLMVDIAFSPISSGTRSASLVIDYGNSDQLIVALSAASSQGVISFTLINANTDQPVAGFDPMVNGSSIDLLVIGTDQLNIRANTNPSVVGSVAFNLQGLNGGSNSSRTENVAPYAMFGDAAGNYAGWAPSAPQPGYSYILTGMAYSQKNSKGNLVGSLTINFSFVDQGGSTQPPVANAGADQNITLPINSTILNGSGNDPDGGSIAGYLWTQQSGPSTASLTGATTSNLTAGGLIEGIYVFRLTVTDDEGETGFDEVQVTVSAGQPPVANSGSDQSITLPSSSIVLSGSGSDPDGGSIVAYLWTQQSGPATALFSGATTSSLTASGLIEGVYVFRLTVTDDEGDTGFDEVQVTVNAASSQGVVSFSLIDAATELPIAGFDPIPNGSAIDLSLIGTTELNIRANTNPAIVGSVVFSLEGFNGGSNSNRTENVAPYALFGDAAGNYAPWSPATPQSGFNYILTGTAYDQSRAKGNILGSNTINFSFTAPGTVTMGIDFTNPGNAAAKDSNLAGRSIKVYPNPTQNQFIVEFQLEEKESLVIALHDLTGRTIEVKSLRALSGKSSIEFDLRDHKLSAGSYYLQINSTKIQPVIHKLLIE